MASHTKLSETERQLLADWKNQGLTNGECARRLSRDPSTIGRELTRNTLRVKTADGRDWHYIYEPLHAQQVSQDRKAHAWESKEPLKNKQIYAYVTSHLRRGWSPEQIAGRLRRNHPYDPAFHICHETIYQFIYRKKTDKTAQGLTAERVLDQRLARGSRPLTVTDTETPWYEYLRRKQTKRRKLKGRKVTRVRIPDRVSIHDRPTEIETRTVFGHWEGDSIVGVGHRSGLHTEYERLSSFIRIEKMDAIDGASFVNAADAVFTPLPSKAKQSTTLDNGSEHAPHREVEIHQAMRIYFADPYRAGQRGGNENGNLWIRYYFPKGTDFRTIPKEDIKDAEWEINNRPRKRLGYKTPQEVFTEQLEKLSKGCNRS